jgi:hypothetical protein
VSKYGNRKTVRDGINFDSAAEADHYGKLVALLRTGYISDLRWQVSYPLVVNGVKVSGVPCRLRLRGLCYGSDHRRGREGYAPAYLRHQEEADAGVLWDRDRGGTGMSKDCRKCGAPCVVTAAGNRPTGGQVWPMCCYRCGNRGTPERPLQWEPKELRWRCAWPCMDMKE